MPTAPILFRLLVVVVPVQPWIELTTQRGYTHDFGYFLVHDYFRFASVSGIALPTWQHLWFVGYLWIYTMLLALAVARILNAVTFFRARPALDAGWQLPRFTSDVAMTAQDLHFRDDNRRFTEGTLTLVGGDGSKRPLRLTAAGPGGFHLGTAGYYGWNDWVYGEWVGDLKVEGNHVTDCDSPENARKLHQLRDLLVRVEDPVGGGTGLGNLESFALGAVPELGLTEENSFL